MTYRDREREKPLSWSSSVALMSQYIPHFGAKNDPLIGRKITKQEYESALDKLIELDLDGWMQLDEKERVTTAPLDWRCRF